MANTLKLEIVTPSAVVYSEDVSLVALPGRQGDMGIYPNHVPYHPTEPSTFETFIMSQILSGAILPQMANPGRVLIFITLYDAMPFNPFLLISKIYYSQNLN